MKRDCRKYSLIFGRRLDACGNSLPLFYQNPDLTTALILGAVLRFAGIAVRIRILPAVILYSEFMRGAGENAGSPEEMLRSGAIEPVLRWGINF